MIANGMGHRANESATRGRYSLGVTPSVSRFRNGSPRPRGSYGTSARDVWVSGATCLRTLAKSVPDTAPPSIIGPPCGPGLDGGAHPHGNFADNLPLSRLMTRAGAGSRRREPTRPLASVSSLHRIVAVAGAAL